MWPFKKKQKKFTHPVMNKNNVIIVETYAHKDPEETAWHFVYHRRLFKGIPEWVMIDLWGSGLDKAIKSLKDVGIYNVPLIRNPKREINMPIKIDDEHILKWKFK